MGLSSCMTLLSPYPVFKTKQQSFLAMLWFLKRLADDQIESLTRYFLNRTVFAGVSIFDTLDGNERCYPG